MNILTFLLSLAILGVGFAGGMAFATIFHTSIEKELRAENRQLRSDLRLIKRQKKDTVEIVYPTNYDKLDFSNKW